MSSIFSSIGSALSGVFSKLGGGNLGTGLTRGAGIGLAVPSLISQLGQAGQENQYINSLLALQKQYQGQQSQYQNLENQQLSKLVNTTPTQAGQQISQLTQPLSADLVSSVSNPVQAYLAERGLAQAPGIQAQTLAQALAPYQLQEQQLGLQGWQTLNQLPFYAQQPYPPGGINFPQPAGFQGIASLLMNQPQANKNTIPYPYYSGPGAGSVGQATTQLPFTLPPGYPEVGIPQPTNTGLGLASPYYMDPSTAQPPWMAQLA